MSTLATSTAASRIGTLEQPRSHAGYRRDIDGLRAIAVLAVLVFHAFPAHLNGGFVGVDVFFVISGFLITKVIIGALESGSFSVADFYARRIRRIFPALVIVLAACFLFGWKTLLADDLAHLSKHIVGGATFLSNIFLWSESGYFDKASEYKPLLHLWSLGIEEQFYMIWPLILGLGWRRGLSVRWLIGGAALLSFLVNIAWVGSHPVATFYSPLSRAWELLIGALAAQMTGAGANMPAWLARLCGRKAGSGGTVAPSFSSMMSVLGLLMIAFAAGWLDPQRAFPGGWALLPVLGTALILMAGPAAWLNRKVLAHPAMVAVGLISYPLYLWHWPLLTLVRGAVPDGDSAVVRLLLLSASFVLAWATYQLVEKPLRFGTYRREKVALLCVAMAAVAVVAAVTYEREGIPSRYPEIIQTATQYDLEGYRAALRNRKCFMDLDQDALQYSAECVDPGDAPLWVLWGDSGAATLYPGFQALAARSGKFRMAQFTSSSCPPMIGYESTANPACRRNNDWTFDSVKRLAPDVVMLSAIWGAYDKVRLPATIARLREAGVKKVIILGPMPAWKDTPSRIIFNMWKSDPLHRLPPARLDYVRYGLGEDDGAHGGAIVAETALREMARQTGASYVSILGAMCNAEGCLMRESARSGDAFYLDIVHLNKTGSEFAVNALAGELGIDSARP